MEKLTQNISKYIDYRCCEGSSCAPLPFVYISHVTRMVNGWLVKVLSSAQLRSAVVKLNVSFSHMAQDVPKRFKHVTCYTFQRYKKSTKKKKTAQKISIQG